VKKLGEGWKQKMLKLNLADREIARFDELIIIHELQSRRETAAPERLTRLLDQVLKEGRAEAQILETLSTATLGRLPTETEKKLVLAGIASQIDKPAAWRIVLKTLAGTSEAKRHADELNPRGEKNDKK
jgi:hypothetical protein